jgi:hypothetical protein
MRFRAASSVGPRHPTVHLEIRIGLDDILHQSMPDDVSITQVDDRNPLSSLQSSDGVNQTAGLVAFEVDLGVVPRDNHLAILA